MMGNGSTRFLLLGLLVLAMFWSPGVALKCFQCDSPAESCTKNVTCKADENACLRLLAGGNHYYRCWKYEDCSMESIGKVYSPAIAQYHCCQRDLCNTAGMGTAVSQATMISGLLMVLVASFLF